MSHTIGVDIGGTKVYAACYDENFKVIKTFETSTDSHQSTQHIYFKVLEAINQVRNHDTSMVGIACAGFVGKDKHTIKKNINISITDDFPMGKNLEKDLAIPVTIDNDAALFAYAENHLQTPKPSSLIGLTIGTGVGCGIILEGAICGGAHNFAGEIGHIKVGDKKLEQIIAGPPMTELLKEQFPIKSLKDMNIYMKSGSISPQISTIIKPQKDKLIQTLANLSLIFDPDQIVIGGGAGIGFWKYFASHIQKGLSESLENYPIDPKIRFSELKNAGALGAAMLARHYDQSA